MEKINCLICGMSDSVGGIETYIITQFRALDKEKFHYDFVFSHKDGEMSFSNEILNSGSKIFRITNSKQWKSFFSSHSGEYDFLVFNTPAPVFLPFITGKKYGNLKRIIVHSHNSRSDMPWYIKMFVPVSLKYVQLKIKHVAAQKWACSKLAGYFMFGKNSKFTIIRNAIELDNFKFSSSVRTMIRKQNNIEENTFVIGMVGRFDYQKNHRFAIELFKRFYSENKKTELWLIGPETRKELANEIKDEVASNNLSSAVKFFGALTNVNEYYQAMDVFILPSLFEGLPISGIEAQAAGLPCLFSDTITEELLLNSEIVKYLPIKGPSAIDAWLASINEIKKNKTAYYQLRENAFIKVRDAGYEIRSETKRVEALFTEMLNK